MVVTFLRLLGGGVLLYFGAEWLVRGAAGIAARLRIQPLIVGLTVVAYGTSAPELFVGVRAALGGRGGISFGNAVGSNIANLGLILGLTALISPPRVDGGLARRELPTMVLSALLVPVLLLDGTLSRLEGAVLIAAALGYTYVMIRRARGSARARDAAEVAQDASEAAGSPGPASAGRLVVTGLVGLVGLVVGGDLFVDGASALALVLGMSERLVGLTVVAVGTSLPELATSLVAARRGHSDIAVGNVVGSNIFNVLLILGASGVAGPLEVGLRESATELAVLCAISVVGGVFLRTERRISRWEGAVLLSAYVVFLAVSAQGMGAPP